MRFSSAALVAGLLALAHASNQEALAVEAKHQKCHAQLGLHSCILASPTWIHAIENSRIQYCTDQYASQRCAKTRSKAIACRHDTAAESLVIYHKLLAGFNASHSRWSLYTASMAIQGTQWHADCVGKSFVQFAQSAAESTNCPASNAPDTFTQLTNFMLNHSNVSKIAKRKSQQQIQFSSDHLPGLLTAYDPVWKKTSSVVCSYPSPRMIVNGVNGTDPRLISFHLPLAGGTDGGWFDVPFRHTQHEGPNAIEATCAKYFLETKQAFNPKLTNLSWHFVDGFALRFNAKGQVECYSERHDGIHCARFQSQHQLIEKNIPNTMDYFPTCPLIDDPTGAVCAKAYSRLGNAPDKCFSYTQFTLKIQDSQQSHRQVPLHLESTADPFCKLASWNTNASTCGTIFTEWQMTLACCKSFQTVLSETNAFLHGQEPTSSQVFASVGEGINARMLVYDKTFTSTFSSLAGQGTIYPPSATHSSLNRATQIWAPTCALESTAQDDTWCAFVRNNISNSSMATSADNVYMELNNDISGDQVIPLVNTQCELSVFEFPKTIACLNFHANEIKVPAPTYLTFQENSMLALTALDAPTRLEWLSLTVVGFLLGLGAAFVVLSLFPGPSKQRSTRTFLDDELPPLSSINN